MKFKFNLQKVLDYRKTKENLAEKEFREAQFLLNEEINKLNSMLNIKHQSRQRAFNIQHEGGNQAPQALQQVHDFVVGQDVRIEKQRAKVKEAEKLVEEKQEILRQISIEYKIMDKLKEKKKNEFKLEVEKIEQKEFDEMSVLRFDVEKSE